MNKYYIISIFISILITLSIFFSGLLLYGWDIGDVKQFEISTFIHNTIGKWSLGIGASIALFHIPYSYKSYLISFFVVPLPLILVFFYESNEHPNNDFLFFYFRNIFIGSAFIHLPSIAIKQILVIWKYRAHMNSKTNLYLIAPLCFLSLISLFFYRSTENHALDIAVREVIAIFLPLFIALVILIFQLMNKFFITKEPKLNTIYMLMILIGLASLEIAIYCIVIHHYWRG